MIHLVHWNTNIYRHDNFGAIAHSKILVDILICKLGDYTLTAGHG